MKSAQDRDKRKSKDSQMFGYFSLKAGSEWTFIIDDQTGKYTDEIKHILEGKHRIGRSRSAEYGLVEIRFEKEIQTESSKSLNGELIIYAKSNLAFINEETGSYTSQPTAKQLTGTDNAEILWDKSQKFLQLSADKDHAPPQDSVLSVHPRPQLFYPDKSLHEVL